MRLPLFSCHTTLLIGVLFLAGPARGGEQTLDIRQFGAVPDGKTLCTAAIQKAIDQCAERGGGTVTLPAGRWLSGTVFMKSRVTLELEAGCTLLGSTNLEDYPPQDPAIETGSKEYVNRSLIAGEGLEDVAIRGRGTIDGQGAAYRPLGKQYLTRPFLIRLIQCRDVLVEGIALRDSAMWAQEYLACDRVMVRGIRVSSHVTMHNDGLDFDACRDVCVSDCIIDSGDDAVCLKSSLDRLCENVTITNCVLSSHCNAIKFGTGSNGGFKNIAVSNCVVHAPPIVKSSIDRHHVSVGKSGIDLMIVDGGLMDGVTISNIAISGVKVPIILRLGNLARPFKQGMPKPGIGTVRNLLLSNIVVTDATNVCSIVGLPGHPIENVTLDNVRLVSKENGTRQQADKQVPQLSGGNPSPLAFGTMPAYGFYCRHVDGLVLSNVSLGTTGADLRHAVVCEDATNLRVDGLDARYSPGAAAMLRLGNVRGALISGCQPSTPGGVFLRVEGAKTAEMTLSGNRFKNPEEAVSKAADVPQAAVTIQ